MDDAPPPTDHVLRPHHIVLLSIIMLAYKDLEIKKLPAPFALHLHRVLLNEIAEVAHPKPHQDLIKEIASAPRADSDDCREFMQGIRTVHSDISSAEKMSNFLENVPSLFMEKSTEMRRSLFGYFCRRCYVSYAKLSFSGLTKLRLDYQAWCAGDSQAGYEAVQKDQLNSDLLIHKTQTDKKTWAKPDAYEAWEKGKAVGDENLAAENLRRFFEQHFHENNDSGVRQHALLNLVQMHYTRGEYVAARKVKEPLLSEAITVARTSNDRLTLQHCISMLHRLPPTKPGERSFLNEVQPDLHPLEILYDIKKLLDEQNNQPLTVAFAKIFQALGLYDHWLDVQLALFVEDQQWAQHAVQSVVWREAGCEKLATVEENIVIAFTDSGSEDSNRITVLLNRSYKKARQGNYQGSLSMLLDPDVWRGLTLHDYGSWAHQLWHILALRATRRGQTRLYREFLLPRRPLGSYNEKEYLFNTQSAEMSPIRESLHSVLQIRQTDQAQTAVEHLLRGLWDSEFLCRLNHYRTGIILLADIGLEFGISKRSKRILEEIMPQIIGGEDLEQRAVAAFTLARCIISAGGSSASALREALPYLLMAESDLEALEIYRSLKDVQYTLSVVYSNLELEAERDESAKRHASTELRERELEGVVVDEELKNIFELIALIGAALADR
ncbi:uncharacterized protein LACBIDRAFT_305954 [Laccaria bicolor S238N-H82]|uniref:Anaphase-promoting complex subunit 5 n=1 Tax=Laccaria bicolor (strain S238N-H82 / ATCC MYA-4686) TaxID=486041 RepID=B0CSC2_LACBS|nr:uncharacterized protein LACBIDRAFT_305954 [Laccaria bicolor S238N-H82]EDR14280.1 predicted protein [Laccaria bicolor S238N-H82]|eukprot:XP_001874839.1 predicted protein [Laccaria bicolor S238N-H82]